MDGAYDNNNILLMVCNTNRIYLVPFPKCYNLTACDLEKSSVTTAHILAYL